MKTIQYTVQAAKDLKAIGHNAAAKVSGKIEEYAADPKAFANQVTKLQGVDVLRLRVGNYRVVFTEDLVVLTILKIGHRREIYR